MTTKLTYNQFRSAHKGTPKKELSKLWSEYKEGTYSFPAQEEPEIQEQSVDETPVEEETPVTELSTEEEIHSQMKIADMVMEEHPDLLKDEEPSMNDLCKEYDKLRLRMEKFAFKFVGDAKEKGEARLKELAKLTRPKDYDCSPTDSWKIWFGPTSLCLLINTTKMMGFRVTRGWWQKNYQTTIYVDRELLPNNDIIKREVTKLANSGRYVPRTPVIGVECKLPQGVKDIRLRGGQSGDY